MRKNRTRFTKRMKMSGMRWEGHRGLSCFCLKPNAFAAEAAVFLSACSCGHVMTVSITEINLRSGASAGGMGG